MPYYTRISFLAHRFLLCRTLSPARAKTTSTTRPAPSRESPASTRPPRSREPCPRSAHRIARESSSPARRLSPGCAPPPMRSNPPSEGSAPRQRAGESGFYDPPRAFTGISRIHSTTTVARTVSSLGASRESSSPARRLSPGCAPPPVRGQKWLFPPRRRSAEPASPRTRVPASGTRAPARTAPRCRWNPSARRSA